jgi:hypothetical protein
MKKNPLTTFLVALLTASVLASLGLFWINVRDGRKLRELQPTAQAVNQHSMMIGSLIGDLMEYGKSNPSMITLVESTGLIKTNPPAQAPAQPAAAKPAAK